MTDAAFSLGGNIGDKAARVREAAARLSACGALTHAVLSPLYRTAPWGDTDQDWFVNACLAGDTALNPPDLLRVCKDIERDMGRIQVRRWGPRLIDIDILYVGAAPFHAAALTLPHADMFNRAFVLTPLADIRPGLVIAGRDISAEAARLGGEGIARL